MQKLVWIIIRRQKERFFSQRNDERVQGCLGPHAGFGIFMRRMRDVPTADRPREKLAKKGAAALSETELVEAIIGRGTIHRDVRAVARDICDEIHKNGRLPSYENIRDINGVGPTKAAQVMACFELGRRHYDRRNALRHITTPQDVLPMVDDLRGHRQEHFACIWLNGAGELLGKRVITVGLVNHSLVHPREVFAEAITDRAASIICVHNHPSGSLEPSSQDIAITRQLRDAGTTLGIPVLDHIIVTKNGYCSLKEKGFI
jgi:DNA repair protein RadC